MSFLFVLVLQPLIIHIKETWPHLLLNVWFLDNSTIASMRQNLLKILRILEKEGPFHGLYLNYCKSLIWFGEEDPTNHNPLGCGIPCAAPNGIIVLGAPVGDVIFIPEVVEARTTKIAVVLEHLPSLNNAQAEFCLLRLCLSIPKFFCCLRICDPTHLQETYKQFDLHQSHSLSLILGLLVNTDTWFQATLPLKFGGIGL
jgi:hypothetical protein